jgi:hypothetical protein
MNLLTTKQLPFAPVISRRRLEALLHRDHKDIERIASHAGRYYEPFDRQRMGSTKWRHIDNPMQELKGLQSNIYRAILATYSFRANIIGGIPRRSIKDNMNGHVGQPLLVTLDIKNCFPISTISTTCSRCFDVSVSRSKSPPCSCTTRSRRSRTYTD